MASERKTRSTWGKSGDVLKLDIDPKTHPAWTGQHRIVDSGGQVARFNKRFAGLGVKITLAKTSSPKPAYRRPFYTVISNQQICFSMRH